MPDRKLEHHVRDSNADDRASDLRDGVDRRVRPGHLAAQSEYQCDRRVEMGA
jgi:hypothetical protein